MLTKVYETMERKLKAVEIRQKSVFYTVPAFRSRVPRIRQGIGSEISRAAV